MVHSSWHWLGEKVKACKIRARKIRSKKIEARNIETKELETHDVKVHRDVSTQTVHAHQSVWSPYGEFQAVYINGDYENGPEMHLNVAGQTHLQNRTYIGEKPEQTVDMDDFTTTEDDDLIVEGCARIKKCLNVKKDATFKQNVCIAGDLKIAGRIICVCSCSGDENDCDCCDEEDAEDCDGDCNHQELYDLIAALQTRIEALESA